MLTKISDRTYINLDNIIGFIIYPKERGGTLVTMHEDRISLDAEECNSLKLILNQQHEQAYHKSLAGHQITHWSTEPSVTTTPYCHSDTSGNQVNLRAFVGNPFTMEMPMKETNKETKLNADFSLCTPMTGDEKRKAAGDIGSTDLPNKPIEEGAEEQYNKVFKDGWFLPEKNQSKETK